MQTVLIASRTLVRVPFASQSLYLAACFKSFRIYLFCCSAVLELSLWHGKVLIARTGCQRLQPDSSIPKEPGPSAAYSAELQKVSGP